MDGFGRFPFQAAVQVVELDAGKEITMDPEVSKESDPKESDDLGDLGDIEAGESPSPTSEGTPRSDDDKPLVTAKKAFIVAASSNDGEPLETKGAAPVQFSKGQRHIFLRVTTVKQAVSIIVWRSSFGLKKIEPEHIQIMREGANVDGNIDPGSEYEVVVEKPKAKAKAKGKAKAKARGQADKETGEAENKEVGKAEQAAEPAAKAVAKAKSRGRKPLDAPSCIANGKITTEEENHEASLWIGRLYKSKSPDAADAIATARSLRKTYAAEIGTGFIVDSAQKDLEEMTRAMERAARAGARATSKVTLLGEAFPLPADSEPPSKRAKTGEA